MRRKHVSHVTHTIKSHKSAHLVFTPLLLATLGLFFVFEASSVRAFSEYGNSFYYFRLQALWIGIGIALMYILSIIRYRALYYLAMPLMTVSIIFLMAVLIPGIGHTVNGARRWIDLGIINFQPSELAKFSIIIYLASWFSGSQRKRFFSFLFFVGLLMSLILLQPDMGTAIIIFSISLIIYFLAGRELVYLYILLPVSVAAFYVLALVSPYRMRRFMAFLDPSSDPLGIGYHVNQILISLANGGLLGQGFGASKQKYLFLPEAHTDSIFAIISEEFGFVGSVLLIFVFFNLLYKLYQIALRAPDPFSKYLSGGILAYFGLQIVINLCGMVMLLPLTGVPLPFVSYGGSNILTSFALIGIMLNIRKRIKTL